MTKRRPLALGAAATIGFGSLFFAAPALAEEAAPQPEADLFTQVQELQDAGIDVSAFGTNANGDQVILKDESASDAEAEQKVQDEGTQVLDFPKIEAYADTDIVGGAGYLFNTPRGVSACSVGFSAWSPEGEPALVSAGHCTGDGTSTDLALSTPSTDPGHTGNTDDGFDPNGTGVFGQFGFSQFGGAGNRPAEGDENGNAIVEGDETDISVINLTDDKFDTLAEVTDWSTAGQNDLSAGTKPVAGVGQAAEGQVQKSGRTTGYTQGEIDLSNPEHIVDGYAVIENRLVRGFASDVPAGPGDSGGAVTQNGLAVGVISGGVGPEDNGGEQWTWSTNLQDGLSYTGGYTIAFHIDAPEIVSPENDTKVGAGSDIEIKVPSNADALDVSWGEGSGETIPAEGGSTVTVSAPEEPGAHTLSVRGANGFNQSEAATLDITVGLGAPTITSPKEGDRLDGPVEAITGTGSEGATVTLTGDVEGEATVEDGTWSVPADLSEVGAYSVTAQQATDDDISDERTSKFEIIPVEPEITSITPNQEFENDKAPTEVSGTGIPGATVTVDLTQSKAASAMVDGANETVEVEGDGTWTAGFGGAVVAGSYSLSVTQTENEVASDAATVSFVVLAAPSEADADADGGDAGGAADGGDAGGAADGGDNGTGGDDEAGTDDGDLANTGAGSMLPFAIGAVLLLAAGGGAILIAQRRQAGAEL